MPKPSWKKNSCGTSVLTIRIAQTELITDNNYTSKSAVKGDISTLDGTPLKLVDKFTYLGSSVASTEKDIDTRLMKAWTIGYRLYGNQT